MVWFKQGALQEARTLFEQVLDIQEQTLDLAHSSTLNTRHNLAHVVQEQGSLPEAEVTMRLVMELYEAVLGAEHPDTLQVKRCYAALLAQMSEGEQTVKSEGEE